MTVSIKKALAIVGLCLALGACGAGSDADTSVTPTPDSGSSGVDSSTRTNTPVVTLKIFDQASRPVNSFSQFEIISLALEISNSGDQAMTLDFGSAQQYEFEVLDDKGARVWLWSADKVFAQSLSALTIPAGDTVTLTETWDQVGTDTGAQVAPGDYVVRGWLPGVDDAEFADLNIH